MPLERGDCGVHGRIDRGARAGRDHGPGTGSKAFAQRDDIVQRHLTLSIAGREVFSKAAEDRRIVARDRGCKAVRQGLRVGEELAKGEIAVARPELRIRVDGPLEGSGREARRRRADARGIGGMAGLEVAGRETERWVTHGFKV